MSAPVRQLLRHEPTRSYAPRHPALTPTYFANRILIAQRPGERAFSGAAP